MSILEKMQETLCSKGNKLFGNSVVMMQSLTVIPADRLPASYVSGYGSADELVMGIMEYLAGYHAGQKSKDTKIHIAMVMNLINVNENSEMRINPDHGEIAYINYYTNPGLRSNISNMINGKRPVPLYWRKAYGKVENRDTMVCRLAWVLQYLEVYYFGDSRMANRIKNPITINGYTSYYEIRDSEKTVLKNTIDGICKDNGVKNKSIEINGYYDLAAVLLEMVNTAHDKKKAARETSVEAARPQIKEIRTVTECKNKCDAAGRLFDRYVRGERVDFGDILELYRDALSCIST